MRIGILTFHSACNFGAFLQVYALSSKASEFADVEVLDYICEPVEKNYDPKNILKIKGNILKKYVKYFLRYRSMGKNRERFRQATLNWLPIGTKRMTKEMLAEVESDYDFFLVGSDQVWNTDITKFDTTFFLDFVQNNEKKASFAASVGTPEWNEEETERIRDYLRAFRYISVRESSTKNMLSDLTGRTDIVHTIDPVFLKTKKEWHAFAKCPKMENYILFFMMGISKTADAAFGFAASLAKKQGKKLLLLSDQDRPYYHPEVKHLVGIGPEEFVGYLVNASCVISNSFHATAMSVILEKEFWVETNIKRSERITELLFLTGLSDRTLVNGVASVDNSEINWVDVRKNIASFISDEEEYLKQIVQEDSM